VTRADLRRLYPDLSSVPGVRRLHWLLFALLLVLAACAGETVEPTSPTGDPPTETTATTTDDTVPDQRTTTTTATGPTTTVSDRPLAPDFTLELGDGGEYTLSEGAKPVYLVFWAEW
jgi:ABC-type glycerol-3-phosphate transport system substrate-binding protein